MVTIQSLMNARPAVLVFQNGKVFRGTGIGKTGKVFGECVFTTNAGAGYDELLTDPNTKGTLNIFSYPLIGNFGISPWEKDSFGIYKWFESNSIKTAGLIIHELCVHPSHYESTRTFEDFMNEGNLSGIEGLDTRQLTHIIRDEGTQMAMLQIFNSTDKIPSDAELVAELSKMENGNNRKLYTEVSRNSIEIFSPKEPIGTVVAIDFGIKNSLLRNLLKRNMKVVVVPYNTPFEKIMEYHPNGVLLSNGPGNPKICEEGIETTKKLLANNVPTMGIDFGNCILGLAAGAKIIKLKFGHHGSSKPVKELKSGRVFSTGQYHNFAIDKDSISNTGFHLTYEHLDDHSCEGIAHDAKPLFGVQFPPGGFGAPEDTNYLYDEFMHKMGLKQ